MFRQACRLNQLSGIRMIAAVLLCTLAGLPGARAAAAPEVIRIGTLPGLRFDTSAFSVRPGAEVELVFTNYDEMLHNFVITRPGARDRVVQPRSHSARALQTASSYRHPRCALGHQARAEWPALTLKSPPRHAGDYSMWHNPGQAS